MVSNFRKYHGVKRKENHAIFCCRLKWLHPAIFHLQLDANDYSSSHLVFNLSWNERGWGVGGANSSGSYSGLFCQQGDGIYGLGWLPEFVLAFPSVLGIL
jgi:hypothetical protein